MTVKPVLPLPLHKVWMFFTTYILTLKRFDLFLQGALLIIVLLDTNVSLLLRRDGASGHLPGNIHDWVAVGAAVVEFLLGAVVAWWGQARKNLALSGWLAVTAVSGLLVLAFPFQNSQDFPVELCGGDGISAYRRIIPADSMVAPRVAMLVLTAGLCALTRLSIWAHGLVYLDDHEPENGAYFYGILISIRLSLGLNGVNWLEPGSKRDDWWEAHLALCMLTLMFAILFTLFPKRMKQYKQIDDEVLDRGLLPTLGRVIRNKAVLMQGCAISFLYAALFSFIRFDGDFVQARFHIEAVRQDPRTSRSITDFFRSLVIIFFVAVFRTRFSVRRTDGVKSTTSARVGGAVAILVAIFFGVLALLSCDIGDVAGVGAEYSQPACSSECGCNSERYGFSPVCALNTSTTYFSPCHAGCRSYEDLNGFLLFGNCECGAQRATRGACSLPACTTVFSLYQLFFALVLAFAGAALLMQGMVFLRAVRPADKTVAVGASFATIALLSHVPGFLLYMLISYLTCAFSHNGACLLHDSTLWSMAVLSAGLSLISAVISLLTSRIPPPRDTDVRL